MRFARILGREVIVTVWARGCPGGDVKPKCKQASGTPRVTPFADGIARSQHTYWVSGIGAVCKVAADKFSDLKVWPDTDQGRRKGNLFAR